MSTIIQTIACKSVENMASKVSVSIAVSILLKTDFIQDRRQQISQ